MTALALYWLFLRAGLLSFRAFAIVPLLRDALGLQRLQTDAQLETTSRSAKPHRGRSASLMVGYLVMGLGWLWRRG